jgi:hypothetical protein
MKIRELKLLNFRSYANSIYTFDRLNIVRGDHGAGKSAIQLAIEWAILGKCAVTDGAGRGAQDLMRIGQPAMEVTITLADGAKISRQLNRGGATVSVVGSAKMQLTGRNAEAWIQQNLGATTVLGAVLNAGNFLAMPEKDQRALLAQALADEPVAIDDEIVKLYAEVTGFEPQKTVASAADVDRVYEQLFKERTANTRDQNALGDIEAPAIAAHGLTTAEIREELNRIEEELRKKQEERHRMRVDYLTQKAAFDSATAQKKQYEPDVLTTEQLEEADRTVRAAAAITKLDQEIAKHREALARNKGMLEQYNEPPLTEIERAALTAQADRGPEAEKLDEQIREASIELRALEKDLSDLTSAEPGTKCGACGQEIKLTAGRTKTIEKKKQSAANLLEHIEELIQKRADIGRYGAAMHRLTNDRARGQLETRIQEIQTELEKATTDRWKFGDLAAAKAKLDAHNRALQPYARAEKTLADIGPMVAEPDTTEIDEAIAALETRLKAGQQIERENIKLDGEMEQYERTQAKKANLQIRGQKLDTLVAYFSDKGDLKKRLSGSKLPALEERINEVLARFGFGCHINLDPYEMTIETNRVGLKPKQLSESQQFRFGVAFQIALAEATGVGFVVIDRSDILLPAVRAQLTEELLNSNLDQAIVMAASADATMPANLPDGVAFFNLAQNSAGVTTVLGAGGKAEVVYAPEEA